MKQSTFLDDDGYEVGYGKPPKETRFVPGQSGNPNGRPKGKKSLVQAVQMELERKVTVLENGKKRTMSVQDATMRRLSNEAIGKGNPAALRMVIGLAREILPMVQAEISQGNLEEARARFMEKLERAARALKEIDQKESSR